MSNNLVTYGKVKTYVQNRLDLRDEGFITADEMLEYCEEALRYCEAEVHKLNLEDVYFEAESYILLSSSQKNYDLPSNIYGNKILRIEFNRDDRIYDISRIRHSGRFSDASNIDRYGSDSNYRYRLINNSPNTGTKIRFHPLPAESSTSHSFTADTTADSSALANISGTAPVNYFVTGTGIRVGTRIDSISGATAELSQAASATGTTVSLTAVQDLVVMHYIRRVEIPTVTTDLIDFPEFWVFVAQHVVVSCLKKELGNNRIVAEQSYLEELRQQMHATLSEQVVDEDNMLESDMSHYSDMSDGGY